MCPSSEQDSHCEPVAQYLAGFTLLEVMVAVAVLSIAIVALLGSQSRSVSLAGQSRFQTTAALLAGQKLTALTLDDFSTLAAGNGDFGEDYPGYRWRLEVEEAGEDATGMKGSAALLRVADLTVSLAQDEHLQYRVRRLLMRPIQVKDK